MSASNGVAAMPPPVKLGALTPKTYPVLVERDGETVELKGWAEDDHCIVSVLIDVVEIRERYMADRTAAGYLRYCEDLIKIVVPDLTYEEGQILAASPDRRDALLTYLKWWAPPDEEGTADPEAGGEEASTTAASSPGSSASTRRRRRTSSR